MNDVRKSIIAASGLTLVAMIISAAVSRSLATKSGASQATTALSTKNEQQDEAPHQHYSASASRIKSATTGTFDEQVLRSPTPVVVDFYADWCGPCQIQGQILEQFAAEVGGATVVKVDVDKNTDLAERFDVKALPTLLIFKDGRSVAKHVGVATNKELKAALTGD